MTEQEFRERLAKASKIINSWPEWKRNLLADSSKPTFSKPREPVNNSGSDE